MTTTHARTLIEQAWMHAEAGQSAQAQQLFQQVLGLEPDNAEAWMMTGVLHAERGDLDQALLRLGRAIEIDPDYPHPYLHLARIQAAAGRLDHALGNARKAVECDDQYAKAWMLLGDLGLRAGDAAGAETAYRRLLTLQPERADARNRLGAVLSGLGRFAEALQECREALRIDPANPEIHANLGNVYSRQGDHARAAAAFEQALRLAPGFTDARLNLGNALRAMGRYQEASVCYRELIAANPKSVEAYLSLGECHLRSGEFTLALENYETALTLAPGSPLALVNRGYALGQLGRYRDALADFNRVIETHPKHADAWFNRGLVEKKLGLFDAAAASLRCALALSPGNQDIQLAISMLELLRGNYRDGWRYYGARKSMRGRAAADPGCLTGDIAGMRIALVKDQGLGDEIFFLRFARALKRRGAWIAYVTDPKIKSIVARLPFLDAVVTESEAGALPLDLALSIGDLPFLLGVENALDYSEPAPLTALPELRERILNELEQAGPGPYVGVTWWAGTRPASALPNDRLAYREIPLEPLIDVLRSAAATPVILQRNPEAAELQAWERALGRRVVDLSGLNDDLEKMLALLACLDDYVGVDNTNMHLSAGLGKPCRILVPHPPEWRMGTQGDSSPWFPGFALYRHDAEGDWDGALKKLDRELKASLSR